MLRGFLSLITLQFPSGTQGHQLDAFSRRPLWEMGLDYDHGTGHGVGHQLLIRENPHQYCQSQHGRWWQAILTIEPGYYLADSHRITLAQVEIVESRPGFCKFASLTLIRWLSRVELDLLGEQEKAWLDAYHQQVREALSQVNGDARSWLEGRRHRFVERIVLAFAGWQLRLARPTIRGFVGRVRRNCHPTIN